MAYNGSQLLPGQSPPLEVITATDQAGVILIATALGIIFAIISLLIRVYLQLEIRHQISRDDVAVLFAMLFAIGQSSAVFVEVSKGFGKTLADVQPDKLDALQKASYASDLLYLIAVWLTKCSVGFLTFRISPDRLHNMAATSALVLSTLSLVISFFIVALACNLSEPWIFINTSWGENMILRWKIVAAFDIISELALLAVSIYLVINLQLNKSKKFVVIFAFALRLPIIITIAFRLHYLQIELTSTDPTLKGSLTAICTQIQISYAIIASTTPCLRPFMSALSTNYGAPAQILTPSATKKYNSSNSNSKTKSYALSSFRHNRLERPKQVDTVGEREVPETRWDGVDHHASVVAGDGNSFDSRESIQMIIQKNTEWDVAFESSGRGGGHGGGSMSLSMSQKSDGTHDVVRPIADDQV